MKCPECEGRGWNSRYLLMSGSYIHVHDHIPDSYKRQPNPKVCVPCYKCKGTGEAPRGG